MAQMTEAEATFEHLKEELGAFLLKIQTVRVLDVEAFGRIDANVRRLAEELRNQTLVPKAMLKEIRSAAKILQAEAAYMREEQGAMLDMAGKLEMTFDLILLGEDHSDRIPGVPRII